MSYAPSEEEVASDYASALDDMTSNSRPQITALTDVARDSTYAAGAIARTIVTRIQNSPSQQVLPPLYLMDSIAKTVGGAYLAPFGATVVGLFTDTYVRVDPSTRQAMVRLLSTWQGVFSDQALHAMAVFVSQYERPAPPPAALAHAALPLPTPAADPNLTALLAAWPALAQQAGLLQQLMASGALNAAVLQQLLAAQPSAAPAPVYSPPVYATPVSQQPPSRQPPPSHNYYNPSHSSHSSTSHSSENSHSSSTSLSSSRNSRPHEAIIRSLHADIPNQCPQCALRFLDKEKLRDHMDMHWKQNRRTQAKKVFSRPWFLSAEEWGRTSSSEGTAKASTAMSVFGSHNDSSSITSASAGAGSVSGNSTKTLTATGEEVDAASVGLGAKCGVCGEQFEKYYHDERECWLFKGGIRHPSNPAMLVHIDCLGDAEQELLAKHQIAHADAAPSKRTRSGN